MKLLEFNAVFVLSSVACGRPWLCHLNFYLKMLWASTSCSEDHDKVNHWPLDDDFTFKGSNAPSQGWDGHFRIQCRMISYFFF